MMNKLNYSIEHQQCHIIIQIYTQILKPLKITKLKDSMNTENS